MARTTTIRKYGKNTRKQTAEILFAQLPKTPVKSERQVTTTINSERHVTNPTKSEPPPVARPKSESQMGPVLEPVEVEKQGRAPGSPPSDEMMDQLIQQFDSTGLDHVSMPEAKLSSRGSGHLPPSARGVDDVGHGVEDVDGVEDVSDGVEDVEDGVGEPGLRVLTWADVCADGDRIDKIAEASFAEVYRITNAQGTSIIKVIRLQSPIKQQTKAQVRSGLVDEEPHSEDDMQGELRISEWLADIPGFVVYKEKYIVQGKAPKALLETHQAFHRRMKRSDPDRLQFYPSPSRYLDDTRFLVIELGDAGTALEDFELTSISQVWDIFLHTALALARAEDLIEFEHRDLHEGNLCIRQVRRPAQKRISTSPRQFGFSGLEVTILDYGLCRASNPESCQPDSTTTTTTTTTSPTVIAYDLEKDLTLFQSTHAPQCAVYRQMRAFLIHGEHRVPEEEEEEDVPTPYPTTPYPRSGLTNQPISWSGYFPYTNVLWLAYLYRYLERHFSGDARALKAFRRETRELRAHLGPGPESHAGVPVFPSAGEVVRFAMEAGWISESQVVEDAWVERSFVGGCNGDGEGSTLRESMGVVGGIGEGRR
ncbi:hypothetical protein B0I37DRAFT_443911 [Chaetomium sp. MPI-CAGE-AT-0009]|nr:hypothetical protein B0I37DRAFT_443911 [Chaetomium sp. MPI-CAGE-AT-0009]